MWVEPHELEAELGGVEAKEGDNAGLVALLRNASVAGKYEEMVVSGFTL